VSTSFSKLKVRDGKIVAPDHPMLRSLRLGTPQPDGTIHVPNEEDAVRLLRNLGFVVPAPIMSKYQWPGPKPFRVQRVTAAAATMNKRLYILSEMGTGKTRAALYAADYLLQQGLARRVLVAAPLSTLSQVWDREVFEFFPHLEVAVLHGTRDKRLQKLASGAPICVINHDGVQTIQKELIDAAFDVIILDEASVYRNKRTERWKAMNALVVNAPYVWALTGSPAPNAATDAWGLARMVTPDSVPKHFNAFRDQTQIKVSTFRWVNKHDAIERVYEALQPAVRFKRDDCIELPPTTYIDHKVDPSPRVAEVYRELNIALRKEFAEGTVTAANEGVLMSKLLQVSSGFVYTRDKKTVALGCQDRMDALQTYYYSTPNKLLVFCAFTHTAEAVYEDMLRRKLSVALVTGATPKAKRDEIFGAFNRDPQPRMIVAHPQCMSHGLTLVAADTVVWFSPVPSLEIYEQACARITRPGQKHKQYIIHLYSTPVERKVYARLRNKASVQGALLDLFNDE
jgi:SNF2 family DNA or RNA helicase